ncbi:MAG TPA: TIGR00341 family protein [Spirochaetota bacterium]|nr:TIGR00341 family protein [Spirochaetota bacterium]HNT12671.1 TIGR00341 family protein [Spirochaetota bacterium]
MAARKKQVISEAGLVKGFIEYLRGLFYIDPDTDQKGTVESITRGVEFRGIGLWTLIFAIYIASIGLNTNSTAVIIGAMLISPLMGPIMGAGLALGIYDFELLKKSLRNLAVMTGISIATSAVYFYLSPLSDAQSELLARTTPTVYDVLIAVFGGAAGIVAGSRKEKISNVIPGVAIATALMPPLCTAGFGLATGNLRFFAGAFYLYLINSVFIGMSTLIFVRYFRFKRKTYLDRAVERKIHRYVLVFSVLFILPSVYLAYDIITEANFKRNAARYVANNFMFERSRVISTQFVRRGSSHSIEVALIGEPISAEMMDHLKKILPQYDLEKTELKIIQPTEIGRGDDKKHADARMEMMASVKSKDDQIRLLESELQLLKSGDRRVQKATKEANILFPSLESISFGDLLVHNVQDLSSLREVAVIVKWKAFAAAADKKRLELFLKSRLEIENLKVLEGK